MNEAHSTPNNDLSRNRLPAYLFLLVGGGLALVWAIYSGWQPPIQEIDIEQGRLDAALPPPTGDGVHWQTFIPRHNGLTEIELLGVHFGDPTVENGGIFELTLLDNAGIEVAKQSWRNTGIQHNQTLRFAFPPQPLSVGREYTLVLSGNKANQLSVWGYQLPTLSDGTLHVANGGDAPPAVLRFTARYQLLWRDAIGYLTTAWRTDALFLTLAAAFMVLPGALLMPAFPRHWSTAAKWGVALSLGVSMWAIIWHWSSWLGFRWSGIRLWALFTAGWAYVLMRWFRALAQTDEARLRLRASAKTIWRQAPLMLLLGLILGVRLLAIRDLAFPPWVDSMRHALITAVMRDSGQIVSGYRPYLPVDSAPYHFGFHALSASLALMTDVELPRLLLFLGQLLNGLIPLVVYAGMWLISGRRLPSWLAAFLVGLPFFFPSYYATWGRFTQLTAMLIMPAALALTWRLLHAPSSSAHPSIPRSPILIFLIPLLSAGIFLTHFRVFLFYLPFALLVWLIAMFVSQKRRQKTANLTASTILGALFVAPRAIQLIQLNRGRRFANAPNSYHEFPAGYVTVGWEKQFLIAGGVALAIAGIAAWRGKKWGLFLLALAGWVGIIVIFLTGRLTLLPNSWLVNLNSAYISFFLPLAWLLALVADYIWRLATGRIARHPQVARLTMPIVWAIAGGCLTLSALFGVRQGIDILNDTTILARPEDKAAIEWVAENVPAEARVAVNSWQWLGTTWATSDGGGWLNPLLARQISTPPVDYIYGIHNQVRDFNQAAQEISDWSDPNAAQWLIEQGYSHIFVGARGGFFDPAALGRNPAAEMIFSQDGAYVFQLNSVE